MIPAGFKSLYNGFLPDANAFLEHVKEKISSELKPIVDLVEVTARVKSVESCFQKMQTGKYASFEDINDRLGVAVVVRRRSQIREAMNALNGIDGYEVDQPSPEGRYPADFSYREPKMFIGLRGPVMDKHPEWQSLRVEVQFTTALQHAVDYATHDYDYKGADYLWAKFRMVARLRAMLELVDAMIDDIDSVNVDEVDTIVEPEFFATGRQILEVLDRRLSPDVFPPDRRRLADTIRSWLSIVEVSPTQLDDMLGSNESACTVTSVDAGSIVLGVLSTEVEGFSERLIGFDGTLILTNEAVSLFPSLGSIGDVSIVKY